MHLDANTFSHRACQMELASPAFNPFSHPLEAEVMSVLTLNLPHIEAASVVNHPQGQFGPFAGERNLYMSRVSVQSSVADRFASHHQQVVSDGMAHTSRRRSEEH